MRKKIILGIVILVAIVGAVYFNINYAVVEDKYGNHFAVRVDSTRILEKINDNDWDVSVKCTPSLKRLVKLEKLWLAADERMNLKYLSEMKDLNELTIFYYDGYCGQLDTLPDLPNVKQLNLLGDPDKWNAFTLNEKEYNFSNIDTLVLQLFDDVDFDALEQHFKKLHTLEILHPREDAKEELIKNSEKLKEKGIDVEIS